MTTLLVTGTGPGVGTSTVAAAVAALAAERGAGCAVIVPASTGEPENGPTGLTAGGVERQVLVRYPDPLSPAAAARHSGRPALDPAVCVQAVLSAQRRAALVLVDVPGGLLVRYDEDGFTMAELARSLRLPVLVVAGAGADAVNAAALSLEAAAHRGLELVGIVVGRWPLRPSLVARSVVADLEMLAARPLLGALPDGLAGPVGPDGRSGSDASDRPGGAGGQGGQGGADRLTAAARHGLGPALGGQFDAAAFRRAAAS